jgi:hypothetical protein
MSWHKAFFTDDQVGSGEHQKLRDVFIAAWIAAGSPKRVAVFLGKRVPGEHRGEGLHPIYFSPAAIEQFSSLITRYSAEPCEVPFSAELSYYGGDESGLLGWG